MRNIELDPAETTASKFSRPPCGQPHTPAHRSPVNLTDEKVFETLKFDGVPACAYRQSLKETFIEAFTPEMARKVSQLRGQGKLATAFGEDT